MPDPTNLYRRPDKSTGARSPKIDAATTESCSASAEKGMFPAEVRGLLQAAHLDAG